MVEQLAPWAPHDRKYIIVPHTRSAGVEVLYLYSLDWESWFDVLYPLPPTLFRPLAIGEIVRVNRCRALVHKKITILKRFSVPFERASPRTFLPAKYSRAPSSTAWRICGGVNLNRAYPSPASTFNSFIGMNLKTSGGGGGGRWWWGRS